MVHLDLDCTFSPQLLVELIRPTDEVWNAVQVANPQALQQWLQKYPTMDLEYERPECHCALLYSACRFGHIECVTVLLENCTQINSQLSSKHSTALHAAAFFGHPHIAQLLLENLRWNSW